MAKINIANYQVPQGETELSARRSRFVRREEERT